MDNVNHPNRSHMPSPSNAAINPNKERNARTRGIPQSFKNVFFISLRLLKWFSTAAFPLFFSQSTNTNL